MKTSKQIHLRLTSLQYTWEFTQHEEIYISNTTCYPLTDRGAAYYIPISSKDWNFNSDFNTLVVKELKNVIINDFSDQLPKQDFTWPEWDELVNENPQYLSITANELHAVMPALTQDINNLNDTMAPINIIQNT